MLCEDLSIWTRTSARAGVSAKPAIVKTDIATPANSRPASHPPDNRFMIAPPPAFDGRHDVVFNYTL
jgi:hypothetical protein